MTNAADFPAVQIDCLSTKSEAILRTTKVQWILIYLIVNIVLLAPSKDRFNAAG